VRLSWQISSDWLFLSMETAGHFLLFLIDLINCSLKDSSFAKILHDFDRELFWSLTKSKKPRIHFESSKRDLEKEAPGMHKDFCSQIRRPLELFRSKRKIREKSKEICVFRAAPKLWCDESLGDQKIAKITHQKNAWRVIWSCEVPPKRQLRDTQSSQDSCDRN
jgi:hypothetical protein